MAGKVSFHGRNGSLGLLLGRNWDERQRDGVDKAYDC